MIKVKKGMSALVVGMGRSGVGCIKLLNKKGVKVTITDEKNKTDLTEYLEQLEGYSFKQELGKHVLKTFCDQDFIVLSPGVSLDIKPLEQARKTKVPIISEVELASQFISDPIIAVTGTNGKSTTASLIAEIINHSGKTAFLGGNFGVPLSEYAARKEKCDYVVAEVSSFQLDTTFSLKPAVSIFMNIAPDHLDRYKSFDEYATAKLRLKQNMTEEDHVIVNYRDAKFMSAFQDSKSKVLHFNSESIAKMPPSQAEKYQGCYLDAQGIHLKTTRWKDHLFTTQGALLRGSHNRENMMAAILAAKLAGVTNESIQKSLIAFKPLPHRMEFVARKNQVTFINDSKGTNIHSLVQALQSFHEPVILIAGGKDKGEDFTPLAPYIQNHVKNLILVGEAKEKMNRSIGDFSETFLVGTFEEAVYLAYQKSRSGDVVLLSPGCSSYDMFKDFEERGETFKKIVGRF